MQKSIHRVVPNYAWKWPCHCSSSCSFSLLLIQQQKLPFRSQCLFVNVAKNALHSTGGKVVLSLIWQKPANFALETASCYLRQEIEIRSFTWWHFSYCLILKKEEGGKHLIPNRTSCTREWFCPRLFIAYVLHSVRNYTH